MEYRGNQVATECAHARWAVALTHLLFEHQSLPVVRAYNTGTHKKEFCIREG
jgi:hypothetical protein